MRSKIKGPEFVLILGKAERNSISKLQFLRPFQALTPKDVVNSLGMTTINELVTPLQGFFLEALITFVLVLTVEAVCDDRRTDLKGSAPLAIGLSIATCHLGAVSALPVRSGKSKTSLENFLEFLQFMEEIAGLLPLTRIYRKPIYISCNDFCNLIIL